MIRTAKVVSDESKDDEVGLYNTVDVYFEDDDETETYKIVTTIRGNSLKGLISSESPLGRALLGHKVGDRVHVQVNDRAGYDVIIKRLEKTVDDGSDAIRSFKEGRERLSMKNFKVAGFRCHCMFSFWH